MSPANATGMFPPWNEPTRMRKTCSPVLPDLLPMNPYLRPMVWGGHRLAECFGKAVPCGTQVGESFELSVYPGRQSVVAAGVLEGLTLQELMREYGAELLGARIWDRYGGRFPLLVKLLDAQRDLSIQVHPDDDYTRRHGVQDSGKAEAWFVLRSDSGRVAYGLRPGVDPPAFRQALARGAVDEVVRWHAVRPGDVVYVPPGTVHALGRGLVVYEVQQSSDLTFRIYDIPENSTDGVPRELHIEQALQVIDFAASLPGPRPWQELPWAQSDRALLVDCDHFRLNLYQVRTGTVRHAAGDSFLALTVVEGAATVSGSRSTITRTSCDMPAGSTLLVPSRRELAVEPADPAGCTYLIASAGLPEQVAD